MLSLHTNAASLSAQNSISRTQQLLATSQTRLSTGFRVNSAMDDAAGMQIATRLKAQTQGMAVAQRNAQNGISMMQTAEGAFDEVTSILLRMKDLATEAASDTSNVADDKPAMQAEYDALAKELFNIMENTTFGGQKLLSATAGTFATAAVTFQIGAESTETMSFDATAAGGATYNMATLEASLVALGANYATGAVTVGTEISTTTGANGVIDLLNTALDNVGGVRSALGAASNRLDHVYSNLSNMITNTSAAKGRIMDTDFAAESANMTSHQMLLQAGTSMLKQSNSTSSLVMSLLQ
jgi:flagellin